MVIYFIMDRRYIIKGNAKAIGYKEEKANIRHWPRYLFIFLS